MSEKSYFFSFLKENLKKIFEELISKFCLQRINAYRNLNHINYIKQNVSSKLIGKYYTQNIHFTACK